MSVFLGHIEKSPADIDAAVREKQRLAYLSVLIHDLKNPVIAQKRALELMADGNFGKLTSRQREVVEVILESSNYLECLISSILDTYRFSDGAIALNYGKISLPNLVLECLQEVEYLAQDKNISFLIKKDNQNCDVKCDRVQIKRVIMNLLSNQIKYAYENTNVNVVLEVKNNYIYLSFMNNSPSITKDKMAHIFEKYITYAKLYKVQGFGLGLYASKQIIEAHNGKIYAESFPDDRNIFYFCLPLKYVRMSKNRVVTF